MHMVPFINIINNHNVSVSAELGLVLDFWNQLVSISFHYFIELILSRAEDGHKHVPDQTLALIINQCLCF